MPAVASTTKDAAKRPSRAGRRRRAAAPTMEDEDESRGSTPVASDFAQNDKDLKANAVPDDYDEEAAAADAEEEIKPGARWPREMYTGIYPGLNDFGSVLEAIPAEIVRHLTLLKEIDAKCITATPILVDLVEEFLEMPLEPTEEHLIKIREERAGASKDKDNEKDKDNSEKAETGAEGVSEKENGANNGGSTEITDTAEEVKEDDVMYYKSQRAGMLKRVRELIHELMPCLEEKMHVAGVAVEAMAKHMARLDYDWDIITNHEFPDELVYGTLDHPAFSRKELQEPKSAQAARSESRREAIAAKRAAQGSGDEGVKSNRGASVQGGGRGGGNGGGRGKASRAGAAGAGQQDIQIHQQYQLQQQQQQQQQQYQQQQQQQQQYQQQQQQQQQLQQLQQQQQQQQYQQQQYQQQQYQQQQYQQQQYQQAYAHQRQEQALYGQQYPGYYQQYGNAQVGYAMPPTKFDQVDDGAEANPLGNKRHKASHGYNDNETAARPATPSGGGGGGRRSANSGSNKIRKGEEKEPVYCYCQQVSYGEMVGCDGPDCKREWFHLPCIGLTSPPKGQWFCEDCAAKNKRKIRG